MPQNLLFPGYDPKPAVPTVNVLPCGGYVGTILAARTITTPNGFKFLELHLDIADGPYTGWFQKNFENQKGGKYSPKYRGLFRLYYPSGHGGWQDKKNIDHFNAAIYAIQASNAGFNWNGANEQLVGRYVGFLIREAEWNSHVFVEVARLLPVDTVRSGRYELMPRRISKDNQTPGTVSQQAPGPVYKNDDLPF